MMRYVVAFCAILQASIAAPFLVPDAEFGRPYRFQLPVSNPNKIELTFKVVDGQLAPGLDLDKSGLLQGSPSKPGEYTFVVAVFFSDAELCRHDYTLRALLPKVELLDPKATGVQLEDPNSRKPPQPSERNAPPPVETRLTIEPLTTADGAIRGLSSWKSDSEVEIRRNGVPAPTKVKPGDSGHFVFPVPGDVPLIPGEKVVACSKDPAKPSDTPLECSKPVVVAKIRRFGEQARIILGFQQSGASGADSEQRFFFDFYLSRPIPFRRSQSPDPRWRWWGDVRIASVSRQISGPVSAGGVVGSFKSLNVNELAQAAEFLTGIDYRLTDFRSPLWSQSADTRQRFELSFIAGGGATGLLKNPGTTAAAYKADPASPDYPRLIAQFPRAKDFQYISFVPPDRNQYFREYFGGFRLVTRYADRYGSATTGPPAMIAFTVGQNELITRGSMRGLVGRVEAFYPLSTALANPLSSIYLFGTAQLRLSGPQNIDPFHLENASAMTPAPSPTNTLIIPVGSNRDVYSIGLGLDLMKIVNGLKVSISTK